MERNRKCEKFILRQLQNGGCRIESFDGREFHKQTVNEAVSYLMFTERIHNIGLHYYLGPPPVAVRRHKAQAEMDELLGTEDRSEL